MKQFIAMKLINMYASNEYKTFSREAIVSAAVINILSKHQVISNSMVTNSYEELVTDLIKIDDSGKIYVN